jgi:hypothetical protein
MRRVIRKYGEIILALVVVKFAVDFSGLRHT